MQEETQIHTRLLRFGFGLDESRAYWARVADERPAAKSEGRTAKSEKPTAETVFEQHWFGTVSEARVRTILPNMALRYDNYPDALEVLSRWKAMTPATRRIIVHWHLQLADPLYRTFTGDFLVQRREAFDPDMYRDVAIRWVEQQQPGRWSTSVTREFATRLLGAAREAGLVRGKTDPRKLEYPNVPDEALGYGLRLFRSVTLQGTFIDNLYLRSVGLWDKFLADRIRALPDIRIVTQGDLVEFSSGTPDLRSWWEAQAA